MVFVIFLFYQGTLKIPKLNLSKVPLPKLPKVNIIPPSNNPISFSNETDANTKVEYVQPSYNVNNDIPVFSKGKEFLVNKDSD